MTQNFKIVVALLLLSFPVFLFLLLFFHPAEQAKQFFTASTDQEQQYDVCQAVQEMERQALLHPNQKALTLYAQRPLLVYIGCEVKDPRPDFGWVCLPYNAFEGLQLDITNETSFANLLCPGTVDAFFSEHTFEHLTYTDGLIAMKLLFKYLKPGGYFRLAVPDLCKVKTIDDWEYDATVRKKLGYSYPFDHLSGYSWELLRKQLSTSGFVNIVALEHSICDNETYIQTTTWDPCAGRVRRSIKYDNRNFKLRSQMPNLQLDLFNEIAENKIYQPVRMSSLIVEGFKPLDSNTMHSVRFPAGWKFKF